MAKNKVLHAIVQEQNAVHTRLGVWNRGGYCGQLTVLTEDAQAIRAALSIEADGPALSQDEVGSSFQQSTVVQPSQGPPPGGEGKESCSGA